MKPVLLFWVFLVAIFGCQKAEKKVVEPKEVHEINIGLADVGFSVVNGKKTYGFKRFWKFDLLKDSFYVKRNTTYIGSPGTIEIRKGKFNFKQDNFTQEFINAALKTEDKSQ